MAIPYEFNLVKKCELRKAIDLPKQAGTEIANVGGWG